MNMILDNFMRGTCSMKSFGISILFLMIFAFGEVKSQTPFSPGAQITSYTATRVRGYHFVAQSAFNICEVYVPNSMNNNMWHVEIVKFNNSAPPAFPTTTNAFVSQFYADSVTGNNSLQCSVPVSSGDVMGIYGSRSSSNTNANTMANSYDSPNYVTSILGNNTTLRRSGMQFPLNNQQMHDIWSEVNGNTGRIIGYHSCCPTPPKPQGPLNTPTNICAGDTVVMWIPKDSIAEDYSWTVPVGDSILSVQGDTMITIAIDQYSSGGQICVELEDTCIWSGDTCFNYTITQPAAPVNISGPTDVCEGDSAWYTISNSASLIDYEWSVTNATFLADNDTAVHLMFGVGAMDLCVRVKDNCAWSDTTCLSITGSAQPSPANAGPDKTICSDAEALLSAVPAAIGDGTWTIVSGPGTAIFSSVSDPTASFNPSNAGVYNLRWTVNSAGCPSTSDDMQVTVNQSPNANFAASDVCEGSPIGFTDMSNANGGNINSWTWDMNMDQVPDYVIANPIHTYGVVGTFNVRLIVSNQSCADTAFQNVTVSPLPEIDISGNDVCLNIPTEFENTSTISAGSINGTTWGYGDFSTSGTGNGSFAPTHVYPSPGIYTVTMTATSTEGCTATDQIDVEVYHLPVATFDVVNACQFQTSSFEDQSTVTGADVVNWKWSLGGGIDTIYDQNTTYDYQTNGFVPVYLKVTSTFGCVDDSLALVEIFPTPISEFNFKNKVCLGETLDLESVSSIAYGSIDNYRWVVADSIIYTGDQASHYFYKIGLYPVTLKTTSNHGCENTIEKMVPVYENPIVDFTFNDVCAESEITFKDATVLGEAAMEYVWHFGDSSTLSMDRNPVHVFDTHGVYTVELYVESFKGCSDKAIHEINVFEKLDPKFDVLADSGCSPLYVEFEDKTTAVTDINWKRYWVFGDGDVRYDTANHVYTNFTGKYNQFSVTLQVRTQNDCFSEYTLDSVIYVVPQPKAAYSSTPEDLQNLSTIRPFAQFEDLSRDANKYLWRFGDGATSRLENPTHEWKEAGDYTVTLITSNIYDCIDSVSHSVNQSGDQLRNSTVIIHHENVAFIPSAFTPNQDGNNEVFRVLGLEQIADMRMEIFDRWGNKIHEDTGVNASWDGTNDQNNVVQSGVYGYRISYQTLRGEVVNKDGVVTVLSVD
jgi:gliding motility-associated-like protein